LKLKASIRRAGSDGDVVEGAERLDHPAVVAARGLMFVMTVSVWPATDELSSVTDRAMAAPWRCGAHAAQGFQQVAQCGRSLSLPAS
jgi:hypothetical protein